MFGGLEVKDDKKKKKDAPPPPPVVAVGPTTTTTTTSGFSFMNHHPTAAVVGMTHTTTTSTSTNTNNNIISDSSSSGVPSVVGMTMSSFSFLNHPPVPISTTEPKPAQSVSVSQHPTDVNDTNTSTANNGSKPPSSSFSFIQKNAVPVSKSTSESNNVATSSSSSSLFDQLNLSSKPTASSEINNQSNHVSLPTPVGLNLKTDSYGSLNAHSPVAKTEDPSPMVPPINIKPVNTAGAGVKKKKKHTVKIGTGSTNDLSTVSSKSASRHASDQSANVSSQDNQVPESEESILERAQAAAKLAQSINRNNSPVAFSMRKTFGKVNKLFQTSPDHVNKTSGDIGESSYQKALKVLADNNATPRNLSDKDFNEGAPSNNHEETVVANSTPVKSIPENTGVHEGIKVPTPSVQEVKEEQPQEASVTSPTKPTDEELDKMDLLTRIHSFQTYSIGLRKELDTLQKSKMKLAEDSVLLQTKIENMEAYILDLAKLEKYEECSEMTAHKETLEIKYQNMAAEVRLCDLQLDRTKTELDDSIIEFRTWLLEGTEMDLKTANEGLEKVSSQEDEITKKIKDETELASKEMVAAQDDLVAVEADIKALESKLNEKLTKQKKLMNIISDNQQRMNEVEGRFNEELEHLCLEKEKCSLAHDCALLQTTALFEGYTKESEDKEDPSKSLPTVLSQIYICELKIKASTNHLFSIENQYQEINDALSKCEDAKKEAVARRNFSEAAAIQKSILAFKAELAQFTEEKVNVENTLTAEKEECEALKNQIGALEEAFKQSKKKKKYSEYRRVLENVDEANRLLQTMKRVDFKEQVNYLESVFCELKTFYGFGDDEELSCTEESVTDFDTEATIEDEKVDIEKLNEQIEDLEGQLELLIAEELYEEAADIDEKIVLLKAKVETTKSGPTPSEDKRAELEAPNTDDDKLNKISNDDTDDYSTPPVEDKAEETEVQENLESLSINSIKHDGIKSSSSSVGSVISSEEDEHVDDVDPVDETSSLKQDTNESINESVTDTTFAPASEGAPIPDPKVGCSSNTSVGGSYSSVEIPDSARAIEYHEEGGYASDTKKEMSGTADNDKDLDI